LRAGRVVVGHVVLDDAERGVSVPVPAREVGLVFQDYRLFPHLDVLDNVAFAGTVRRAGPGRSVGQGRQGRRAARDGARAWLGRLGIAELAGRRPAQLSGGQAQRVALARALASGPRMLLLDEPLAALDARTRLEVRGELRRHLTAFGGPSLLVTHDPLEALVLADRVLVLEHGRVVQEGTPAEVARRPATEYVARLVGLNLYAGTATGADGGGLAVALDGGGVLHAAAGEAQPGAGSRVLVAVPPTAVTLHAERPSRGSARNAWAGTVAGLELLTDRVRVAVDGTPSALVDVTPAAVAELGLEAGRPVWLAVKATEVTAYRDPAGQA
jgi:molybdate transport system ATP-binding protein